VAVDRRRAAGGAKAVGVTLVWSLGFCRTVYGSLLLDMLRAPPGGALLAAPGPSSAKGSRATLRPLPSCAAQGCAATQARWWGRAAWCVAGARALVSRRALARRSSVSAQSNSSTLLF